MPRNTNLQVNQLHSNWKFGALTPRTSRQAFGADLDTGHRPADTAVFILTMLGLLVVLTKGWLW